MQDISLEQAVRVLLAHTNEVRESESVEIIDALGRTLAEDCMAAFDNPPFDRSPLDGYAFAAAGTDGASAAKPAVFRIIGEECAGDYYEQEVPAGCDCVVRQESVIVRDGVLQVPFPLKSHENYCFAGEDVRKGTLLAGKGTRLTAAHLGVLAGLGYGEVRVIRRVRVAIASTGDELLQPGMPLQPGKIYNSNLYILAGRLRELGFEPKILGILPDDVEACARIIRSWQDKVDLFLTTGGVSVGKKDIMHGVVSAIGDRLFWRVCMKPGGPAIAYTFGHTLGIALSGNPFASYATFELMARPVLAKLSDHAACELVRAQAVLTDRFPKASNGRRFIRAYHENGKVRLPEQHASGSLASVVGCNAFIDIPAGTGPLEPGTEVDIVLL